MKQGVKQLLWCAPTLNFDAHSRCYPLKRHESPDKGY